MESTQQITPYQQGFERKVKEIYETLEVDAKKALKLVQKELEGKQKKQPIDMLMIRIVRAYVCERNLRQEEAMQEMFGVLSEIQTHKLVNHYLIDTFAMTAGLMNGAAELMERFIVVIEELHAANPKDKELVNIVYEVCLCEGKYDKAAKMASKLVSAFGEKNFALA